MKSGKNLVEQLPASAAGNSKLCAIKSSNDDTNLSQLHNCIASL